MLERTWRDIPSGSNLQSWRLPVLRHRGKHARPRAYLQAALHADEQPGVAVLHELSLLLARADAEGRLMGEIILVPYANPIGLHQVVDQRHLGRLDLASGVNFNRKFPMRPPAGANAPADGAPKFGSEALKVELLALAEGSDIVLDLHCDKEAALYAYIHADLWPGAKDLAARLGVAAVLLWSGPEEGGTAFEAAVTDHRLADLAAHPFVSATVELRGQGNVDPRLARADAEGLYRFLMDRGLVAGDPGPMPEWRGPAVPQDHLINVEASALGTLLYEVEIGARVVAGQTIARILANPGDAAGEISLAAPVDGMLLIRARDRLARPGQTVATLVAESAVPASLAGRTLSN